MPEDDQRRLGVITDWKNGPHRLTYRQAEYTFGLVADALAGDEPGGQPSPALQAVCGSLLEASMKREALVPIDGELHQLILQQQAVLQSWPSVQRCGRRGRRRLRGWRCG